MFFNYAVSSSGSRAGAYTIDASADIDANGTDQIWGYVHPAQNGSTTVGTLGCSGVWDGSSPDAILTVGPCAARYGKGEF